MRTLTVAFAFLLILLPSALSAQSDEGVFLTGVSQAINEQQWDKANDLFRKAIKTNAGKAEDFYWINVRPDCQARKSLAMDLGLYYKGVRNYEKASSYYQELVRIAPGNIDYLSQYAAIEVQRGNQQTALDLYQKVLALDENHLAANIFIGNYWYLKAEQEKKSIESDYKKIPSPTKMQYARYKDGLNRVLLTGYGKARVCLQKVISQFPSTEARKTLDKIQMIEKEVNR